MQFGQLHHIEYYVRDLKATTAFWSWFLPLFGYEQFQVWSGGISWRHSSGTYIVFVELSASASEISNDRNGSGLNHIALMGRDVDHLKQVKQGLEIRQIKIFRRKTGLFMVRRS